MSAGGRAHDPRAAAHVAEAPKLIEVRDAGRMRRVQAMLALLDEDQLSAVERVIEAVIDNAPPVPE